MAKQNLEEILIDDIASFTKNPFLFVMYAFSWGQDELKKFEGPEKWQREVLIDIGKKLQREDFDLEAILEAVASGHGVGKALKVDDLVPTPFGMSRVDSIKVGNFLFGQDGLPKKVLAIKNWYNIPTYRITFDDKSFIDVSSGHLWKVKGRQERKTGKDWRVMSTLDIFNAGVKRPNGKVETRQWEIPQQAAVRFNRRQVNVNPYLYGAWLGNGAKKSNVFTCHPDDRKHFEKAFIGKYELGIVDTLHSFSVLEFLADFQKYNNGAKGYELIIHDDYKFNTIKTRLAVLQGLLDTDGNPGRDSRAEFTSISEQLVDDVIWLARSLGFKTKKGKNKESFYRDEDGNKVYCHISYRCNIVWNGKFDLFRLNRKQNRLTENEARYNTRWIDSIKQIENIDGVCFEVEDNLFLTKDFHVTHNSALVAWIILWAMSTREDTKGVVTANTETQLKTKTWSELSKWYRLCITKHWFVITATALYSVDKEHERTWRFDMVPWSENKTEAFAGMHNKGNRVVVIFDEASAIPDLIWEVTEGALTDEETEILWIAFGNPTRNIGRFHACFNKLRHRWKHQQVDSREVSLTNKQQIETWIIDYGDDSDFVRVRVKGQFPRASTNQFIPTDVVDAARGRFVSEDKYRFAPIIIGIDRAWSGESETKIYLRQGLVSKRLGTFRKDEDDGLVAGHVMRWEDEYDADAVFIDFGYGTGLYSFGKQMGRKWILVPFGGAATSQKYANKRVNMWGDMLDWLKGGGSIPDIEDLCTDLIGPEAFSIQTGQNAGKLILESKKDMQRRGLDSPDDGDALALTFAFPVKNKSQRQFHNLKQTQQSYDPLKFGQQQQQEKYNPLSPLAKI